MTHEHVQTPKTILRLKLGSLIAGTAFIETREQHSTIAKRRTGRLLLLQANKRIVQ